MTRVVVTHPEMGVYLGSFWGLGFWTLLDTAGQEEAVTFENEADARDFISKWADHNDPDQYGYVEVPNAGQGASVAQLSRAGLGHLLGDMVGNLQAAGAA